MRVLKKINVALLVVLILVLFFAIPFGINNEKYGNYNKKIVLTETSAYCSGYDKVNFEYTIENKGNLDIYMIWVTIEITNIYDFSQSITTEVQFEFNDFRTGPLQANSSKDTTCYLYLTANNTWIKEKDENDLLFSYKIERILFNDGENHSYE